MGLWSTTDCQPDEQDRLSNSAAASQGIRRSTADAPKEQEVEAAAVESDNRKTEKDSHTILPQFQFKNFFRPF